MPKEAAHAAGDRPVDDLAAALLTASRVLIGVTAASLAAVDDTLTPAQFRTLTVLDSSGETSLDALAEHLGVQPPQPPG